MSSWPPNFVLRLGSFEQPQSLHVSALSLTYLGISFALSHASFPSESSMCGFALYFKRSAINAGSFLSLVLSALALSYDAHALTAGLL